MCSRHFLHGSSSSVPSLDIGKRFASPKKGATDRVKRAQNRESKSRSLSFSPPPQYRCILSKRAALTPGLSSSVHTPGGSTTEDEPMSVSVEPLLSDFSVHELPFSSESRQSDTALVACVEFVEAETKYL